METCERFEYCSKTDCLTDWRLWSCGETRKIVSRLYFARHIIFITQKHAKANRVSEASVQCENGITNKHCQTKHTNTHARIHKCNDSSSNTDRLLSFFVALWLFTNNSCIMCNIGWWFLWNDSGRLRICWHSKFSCEISNDSGSIVKLKDRNVYDKLFHVLIEIFGNSVNLEMVQQTHWAHMTK